MGGSSAPTTSSTVPVRRWKGRGTATPTSGKDVASAQDEVEPASQAERAEPLAREATQPRLPRSRSPPHRSTSRRPSVLRRARGGDPSGRLVPIRTERAESRSRRSPQHLGDRRGTPFDQAETGGAVPESEVALSEPEADSPGAEPLSPEQARILPPEVPSQDSTAPVAVPAPGTGSSS